MNRGFGFILAVPVLFLAVSFLILINTVDQEERQLEEYVLTFAVDYSTDAAVEEMLNMAHLGQDYSDQGQLNTDPEVALDMFLNMMCLNYDLPLTDTARAQIESSYIPVFCVAAYDGYYMYSPIPTPEGDWYLQSSLKLPYTYDAGTRGYFALNLGGENAYLYKEGRLSKVMLADNGISRSKAYQLINSRVSDDLLYHFHKETGRESELVYMPSNMTTIVQTNAIQSPTVLAFVDGWDFKTNHAISTFSIGGAAIESTRMIAGYVREFPAGTFNKCYAYADLVPTDVNVMDMFTTMEEAARAGYYYDAVYMG